MDTRKIEVGSDLTGNSMSNLNVKPERVGSEVVQSAIDSVKAFSDGFANRTISFDEFAEIIDELNKKLGEIGIYLSFKKIGNIPIVEVKDVQGNVIRTFPQEELARLLARLDIFFDVLTDIILSKYA